MAQLETYILRLLIGSILCATILRLVQEKQYQTMLRTLCGIFLTLLLLDPLGEIRWSPDWSILKNAAYQGETYSAYGTQIAQRSQIQRISEALESYVLDKAAGTDANLAVEVTVGETLLPEYIILRGEVAPDARQQLSEMIERELGIAKENQLWTG